MRCRGVRNPPPDWGHGTEATGGSFPDENDVSLTDEAPTPVVEIEGQGAANPGAQASTVPAFASGDGGSPAASNPVGDSGGPLGGAPSTTSTPSQLTASDGSAPTEDGLGQTQAPANDGSLLSSISSFFGGIGEGLLNGVQDLFPISSGTLGTQLVGNDGEVLSQGASVEGSGGIEVSMDSRAGDYQTADGSLVIELPNGGWVKFNSSAGPGGDFVSFGKPGDPLPARTSP